MLKETVNHRTQKRNKVLGRLQKLNTFSLEEIVTKSWARKKITRVQLVQQTINYKPHFANCNFTCNFLSLMQALHPSYKSLYRAKFKKTNCRYLPWFPSWWSRSRSCHLLSCVYEFLEAVKITWFTSLITNCNRNFFLTSVVLEASK